ncbi:SLC45 family MFS transporter [Lentilactobacillus parabuchneri]|uniref:SLC45 family MFS transporter n=1 Tax=Lentilactobacillus parabuchneri TaxID=152331 RepID=UPI000A101E83|nr:Major Facilitator Superfamily protein [Lentilactobacillus parabuchneri]ORN33025.1 Major Facilitator Superfamily protein [Lentilactobacillus parabuchneri]ORN36800.1 Major Facilitator Superfamily protein [Lentilactobacillus parabuchneri]
MIAKEQIGKQLTAEVEQPAPKTKGLPMLKLSTIFAMTFGLFGVNMAFSLQSSQMGRIFQTIGADPTKLGFFFILPPLAGMVVQPLIGKYSDMTWNRFGRRMPYLMIGAPVAAIVMILLPNAGSFGFGYASLAALMFGAITILFMDLSSNVCMQPFKMIIGDMVNEDQKDKAWSWQQSFSNLGGVLATVFPFLLTWFGVSNVAPKGEVPMSVKMAFYIGAAVLLATSVYTIWSVHEYDPITYARYHGISEDQHKKQTSLWSLVKKAPRSFWEVSAVQLFDWFAFQYLWTYGTGAIAQNVWNTSNPASAGYQAAGNWFGIMTTVESLAAVIWGFAVLSRTKPTQRKLWFRIGLIMGGVGFIWIFFIHSQMMLILPFALIGMSYLTMQTESLSLFTESLNGENEGAYLGLFNCGICLPQIIASVASFALFPLIGKSMPGMIVIAGIMMFIGAFMVGIIHPALSDKSTNR